MEKTFLEKRIEEKAIARFNKDFKELVMQIHHHPIGELLNITLGEKEIPLANFGCNYGLLNTDGTKNENSVNTNLEKVRDKVIEKYTKEETDKILNQFEAMQYLFEQ